jgi:DNA-binding response OmpR family regulator
MTGRRPTILVVGDDWDERGAIASVLLEAGFAVAAVPARDTKAAPTRRRFAAAVVALPEQDGVTHRRRPRRRQPKLPAAIVGGSEPARPIDPDHPSDDPPPAANPR